MISPDLSAADFRKSSLSGGNNDCIEVATNLPDLIAVRDSKNPSGPALAFSPAAWRNFLTSIRSGEF
ncbi:DUF397 domain-containing protein [Streptosporangium sp. NBC_01755]|uniref:DUF397 domain-containing protein n=1 Tax=unclassified Streptosporangium TaxID=2632669 RepID=UPI002DD7AC92|nr:MULTISPECIES: DUF397 domain-containing protein [unclassified Streptosporangium]WSA24955.1 DUF397 domain-containing protein [Streptosporangium sp. NBC_01810]WSD03713.1 DUF397 domain-containing protein [Streptosporangium sp. NBC_01755]